MWAECLKQETKHEMSHIFHFLTFKFVYLKKPVGRMTQFMEIQTNLKGISYQVQKNFL